MLLPKLGDEANFNHKQNAIRKPNHIDYFSENGGRN